jgi:hypothetical protein
MSMKGCKAGYKDGHKYCVKHRCPCLEDACANYGELTNADRIRAMSDEEIADDWMNYLVMCQRCAYANECETADDGIVENCREGILKWLKQPAEGE